MNVFPRAHQGAQCLEAELAEINVAELDAELGVGAALLCRNAKYACQTAEKMLAEMLRPMKATKRARQCSHGKCPSRSAATLGTRSSWTHILSAGFATKGGQRDVRAAPPGVHHRQRRVEAVSPAPRKGRDLGLETTGRRQRVAAAHAAQVWPAQHGAGAE